MQDLENKPVVSVIIPTYNRADLLGRAIRSVLIQTYTDFEIIVVDDASTDNTTDILKSINDPRIRIIRHETNKGGAAARNTGIKASRGKFIAFQDSDDEWLFEKLEKQMKIIEGLGNDFGVVYCGFLLWNGRTAKYIPNHDLENTDGDISKQILHRSFIGTPTVLIYRELFDKVGFFDERMPRLQDWELMIRLSKMCRFYLINEPLVMAYSTPGNMSSSKIAWLRAIEIILDKHYSWLSKHPDSLAHTLTVVGHRKCLYENVKDGRAYFVKSIKMDSYNFEAYIAYAFSFLGKNLYVLFSKLKQFLRKVSV